MRCPIDGEALIWDRDAGELRDTGHTYAIRDGIPILFASRSAPDAAGSDVTEVVKEFYEADAVPKL